MFLDVVDYFANNFGLITIALAEVVTIGLILRRLPVYQNHANFVSDIKLGTFLESEFTRYYSAYVRVHVN